MSITILKYKIRSDIRSILFHFKETTCVIDNINYPILFNNQIDEYLIDKLVNRIINYDNTNGIIFKYNNQDVVFNTTKIAEQKYLYKLYIGTDKFNYIKTDNDYTINHDDSVHYLKDYTEYYHLVREDEDTYIYIANNRSHNKIFICLPTESVDSSVNAYYEYLNFNHRCLYERMSELLNSLITNTEYKIIKDVNNNTVIDYRSLLNILNNEMNTNNFIELCTIYNNDNTKIIEMYYDRDLNRFIGCHNELVVMYNRIDLVSTLENRYETYQTRIELDNSDFAPL